LRRPDGRQRLDERTVGDHGLVVDRLGELEDLEQVERAGGEDGQTMGPLGVRAAVGELVLHALEVGAQRYTGVVVQRLVLAYEARGAIEDRAHFGATRGRRGELARVEIEEERDDLALAGARSGQPPKAFARDVIGLHARGATPAGGLIRRTEPWACVVWAPLPSP
jgi:hypothetical protein